MSATVWNVMQELPALECQASYSSKSQYQLYNCDTSKFCPLLSDPKLSFHDWDTKSNATHSAPLCLCCKCTGHKFSECNEDMTLAGIPTYLRYLDRKLTLHSNPTILFCITFQLNSAKQHCKSDHLSQHACSWCGSTDHGACAQKCL